MKAGSWLIHNRLTTDFGTLWLQRWPGSAAKGKLQEAEQMEEQSAEGVDGKLEDGEEEDGLILGFTSPTLAPTLPSVGRTGSQAVRYAWCFA